MERVVDIFAVFVLGGFFKEWSALSGHSTIEICMFFIIGSA